MTTEPLPTAAPNGHPITPSAHAAVIPSDSAPEPEGERAPDLSTP